MERVLHLRLGSSGMLMQKRGAEVEQHISASEQEYKKQYHRSRRILVVDDEPDITSSFKQPLRDNGFEVETANDPILALKSFKEGSFDLLIIDIVMPEMDVFRNKCIRSHLPATAVL